MSSSVKVSISPMIPLNPDLSSRLPVNGYFGMKIQYADAERKGDARAYKTPSVTISGFVKGYGDTSAVFNTSDEFAAFVQTLQFDDTSMFDRWTIVKPDARNELKIVKKTPVLPGADFVCSLHSTLFNPTNLKGDDGRALLEVKIEDFSETVETYQIDTRKIYISEILSFKAAKKNVKINEEFTLSWNCRGDFINYARLQENDEEPETVGISGNKTLSIRHPATFKLIVCNNHPEFQFRAAAYASVEMIEPDVRTFTADKKYASQGETLTLSWEADSAYCCQINGGKESYDIKGQTTVTADFAKPLHEKDAEYQLTALGFKGKEPFSVYRELAVRRTYWKEMGAVKGIECTGITKWQPGGMFVFEDQMYAFDGTALLSSKDRLSYTQVSVMPVEPGAVKNDNYKCGLDCGIFYIAGVQSGQNVYIVSCDIKNKSWQTTWAGNMGECFFNGAFACDKENGFFYYIFAAEKRIYIYQQMDGNFSLTGHYVFDHSIEKCDCCIKEDRFYLSLLGSDHKIRTYHIQLNRKGGFEQVVKDSVTVGENSVVTCMAVENDTYVMGDAKIYRAADGQQADISYPGRIMAGIDAEEPVMICKTDEGETCKWKLYRLYVKEM